MRNFENFNYKINSFNKFFKFYNILIKLFSIIENFVFENLNIID